MFGVDDFLFILGGTAWLTKEGVRTICEDVDDENRNKMVDSFITEHTDRELEEQYVQELFYKPSPNFEDIWERLEKYKRENPVLCRAYDERYREIDSRGREKKGFGLWDIGYRWEHVGRFRALLRWDVNAYQKAQGEWGKGKMPKWFVDEQMKKIGNNCGHVCDMLMQTHGKMSFVMATLCANDIFRRPTNKRSLLKKRHSL